jgi:hypothetical protein
MFLDCLANLILPISCHGIIFGTHMEALGMMGVEFSLPSPPYQTPSCQTPFFPTPIISSTRSRNTLPRGLGMSSKPTVKPARDSGRMARSICDGVDSLVGSRTVVMASPRLRKDWFRYWNTTCWATHPTSEDRGEQSSGAASVSDMESAGAEFG